MILRFFLTLVFTASLLSAQEKPVVVLELFTSQGCSSCSPADEVLAEIKKTMDNKTVIPISYHVDYWDYIGWKDPYASKANTNKQRFYGRKFESSSIYTPQLVINGAEHLVGSNKEVIHQKIKQRIQNTVAENSVKVITAKKENRKVNFSYKINGDIKSKFIHYLLVLDEKTTVVERGENRNRTLKNPNIVIAEKIEPIDTASGNFQLEIPENIDDSENIKLVVLISDKYLTIDTGTQYTL